MNNLIRISKCHVGNYIGPQAWCLSLLRSKIITSVNTPGVSALPQPRPQLTTPARTKWSAKERGFSNTAKCRAQVQPSLDEFSTVQKLTISSSIQIWQLDIQGVPLNELDVIFSQTFSGFAHLSLVCSCRPGALRCPPYTRPPRLPCSRHRASPVWWSVNMMSW